MSKHRSSFIEGPIQPDFIAQSIKKHSHKTDIGAHQIFLGQVRSDSIDGNKVVSIEYSAYTEMAEEKIYEIREAAFSKFDISCMHIYHSIGTVESGQICLFVFTSSKHRKMAFDSCEWLVEQIKKEVPIWGKEIFEDNGHQWKENIVK